MNSSHRTITTAIRPNDWNDELRGWTCSAITLPSARLRELRAEGALLPETAFQVDRGLGLIRWTGSDGVKRKPLTAVIDIVQPLSTRRRAIEWSAVAMVLAALVSGYSSYQVALVDQGANNGPRESGHDLTTDWIEHRSKADGVEDVLLQHIIEAKNEIWMFGTNFRKAADKGKIYDALIDAARRRVHVRFLVIDPDALDILSLMTTSWGYPEKDVDILTRECQDGLQFIARLQEDASRNGVSSGMIEVKVGRHVPFNRSYIIDPRTANGIYMLIPYSNMTVSAKSPVFYLSADLDTSMALYDGIELAWEISKVPQSQ